jgi:hypothetical protein
MAFFRTGIFAMAGTILFFGSDAGGEEKQEAEKKPSEDRVPLPVAPSKLLEWLPACPVEWELLKSQGRTLFQTHLESHAVREFRVFHVPGEDLEAPPDVMVVAIRDTCGQGPLLEPFLKENAQPLGGDMRLGKWGDNPVNLVRVGPDKQSLRLLIAGRFIVEMVYPTKNNNLRAINPWMKACNLAAMKSAKQETRPPILNRVLLEYVDELDPTRSRRYSLVPSPATEPPTEGPASSDQPPPKAVPDKTGPPSP